MLGSFTKSKLRAMSFCPMVIEGLTFHQENWIKVPDFLPNLMLTEIELSVLADFISRNGMYSVTISQLIPDRIAENIKF